MRFATIASAAALAPALVAATYHADLKDNLGTARVHNRCDHPVYLWSVLKEQGCNSANMKKLEKGETYSETYREDAKTGVSIKISHTEQCKGDDVDITQLEYFINRDNPDFTYNYLDVSFVDCLKNKCPSRNKFYLKSGNNGDVRLATAGADKAVCPILKCSSEEECATMAYILPDDVQTKSCEPAADMDFYLCTDNPEDDSSYEEIEDTPAPSSKEEEKAEPTTTNEEPEVEVKAAAITAAPVAAEIKAKKIKTEVVYVTKYEYVNAKRHAHGHQHKHFRA